MKTQNLPKLCSALILQFVIRRAVSLPKKRQWVLSPFISAFSENYGVKKILEPVQVVKGSDLNCLLGVMALSLSELSQIFFQGHYLD